MPAMVKHTVKYMPLREVYQISVVDPISEKVHTLDLSQDQYDRYKVWMNNDALIQDALPELSDDERELLMTGIGPDEWDETFPDTEEPDDIDEPAF